MSWGATSLHSDSRSVFEDIDKLIKCADLLNSDSLTLEVVPVFLYIHLIFKMSTQQERSATSPARTITTMNAIFGRPKGKENNPYQLCLSSFAR